MKRFFRINNYSINPKKLFQSLNSIPRTFSSLTFLNKWSKLKPSRTVTAFNINKAYEIAENIRTYKGGAAAVLGSLSPRTRNAQVDIYENKKVDYLVATDAIEMIKLNIKLQVCLVWKNMIQI